MRDVFYISASYCNQCQRIKREIVAPLVEKYPGHVSIHENYDAKIGELDNRKRVNRVPLFVVEKDGVEEFRFAGELSAEEIEAIINYDGEVLTLEEVRG